MTVPFKSVIPSTNFGLYSSAANRSCFGICAPPCNAPMENLRIATTWSLDNGSWYYVANDAECPASYLRQLGSGINFANPDDHAYADSGVAVERSAIGAPTTLFSGNAFGNISSQYGQALLNLTQCVPVMVSNPVRCQKSGTVTVAGNQQLVTTTGNITVSGKLQNIGGAVIQQSVLRDLSRDSVMANYLFGYGSAVGQTVIAFGALNDPHGVVPYANYLAGTLNDPDHSAGTTGGETYAVTCFVNPQESFEYRRVSLDLRALGKGKSSNFGRYVSGGEPCIPSNPTISNRLFAFAGSGSYMVVTEDSALDGFPGTLVRLAGKFRGPPYAFPDSTNALEDVLGLFSALAVSRMPLEDEGVQAAEVKSNSTAQIEVTRLGTARNEALLLLIPPLGSLSILCTLFVLGIRSRWAQGGKWFPGHASERPKLYVAESAYELVTLGIRAATGQSKGLVT
ncbi:hypothetical protein F5Y18DRAFT_367798 [Xylariaceae sp. FL1019]|nr:hypothetical protein F5Y18DRAFT_367798 [Xylariaceae sp. FL1019]